MITVNPDGIIEQIDWSIITERIQMSDSTRSASTTSDTQLNTESDSASGKEEELGALIVEEGDNEENDGTGSSPLEGNVNTNVELSVSIPESVSSDVECLVQSLAVELDSSSDGSDLTENGESSSDSSARPTSEDVMSYLMVLQGISGAGGNQDVVSGVSHFGNESQARQINGSSSEQSNNVEGDDNQKDKLESTGGEDFQTHPADDTHESHRTSAVQIVSIGHDGEESFCFHEFEFESIMAKIPDDTKVCIVSVLGAFRTGKSFLMSWFLKYLEHHLTVNGSADQEGQGENEKWYNRVGCLSKDEGSFSWDGGAERNTLGMWMWPEPFFVTGNDSSKMALLLVDTQGMNDNETTGGIQASIFGLSVLMSSYQIYNVNFQIQDDHLQQLAFFTEYGKVALGQVCCKENPGKPFQHVDFLVRNFQHFDLYVDEENDIPMIEKQMAEYFKRIMVNRESKDLQESRDQITSCFQEISSYMLPFPGSAMTRKQYKGEVRQIDQSFLALLDRYCDKVFGLSGNDSVGASVCLQAKTICGRELTACEYKEYVKSYAKTFQRFGSNFPDAETILTATSDAHNARVVSKCVSEYTTRMDILMNQHGSGCCLPRTLKRQHLQAKTVAMRVFKRMATFGSTKKIDDAKRKTVSEIEMAYDRHWRLNKRLLVQNILKVGASVIGTVALLAFTKGKRF